MCIGKTIVLSVVVLIYLIWTGFTINEFRKNGMLKYNQLWYVTAWEVIHLGIIVFSMFIGTIVGIRTLWTWC